MQIGFEPPLHQDERNAGVCFDANNIVLQGIYFDEISLFRARRKWVTTFENSFMLQHDKDFTLETSKNYDDHSFSLLCSFHTACGRYAFWRITNYQAPEAQYEIETAHIPYCESRKDDIFMAPDLMPIEQSPLVLSGVKRERKDSMLEKLMDAILQVRKNIS
ncbi:MAG: hypothetical protein H6619_06465 [Deltaproteobacteria bacterium]|nr:hypothetical protein [Deltaproteobacteria bacterium]